jgi:endonuclease G, mitochondrial
MKYFSILCFLFIAVSLSAQSTKDLWGKIDSLNKAKKALQAQILTINDNAEKLKLERIQIDLKKWAMPKCAADSEIVCHSAMIIGYNEKHEQANWVAHIVNRDILDGVIGRTNDFRPDSLLKKGSAYLDDYWESGYDRGHLAPSADFRWSFKALSESYLYSNMSPQLPEFNREIWADVENMARKFAIDNEEIYIVTGPILKKGLPTIGEKNKISIPEAYYKVILDNKEPEVKGIAFLVPHKGMERNPAEFLVSIDSVEKMSGIDFFPALSDDLENAIEANCNPDKWIKKDSIKAAPVFVLEKGQVSATNAKHYEGKRCTVCGTVVSTRFNASGKNQSTYINLDYTFPNQVFTVVIKGEDRPNFSYLPEVFLKNKVICVRGEVDNFGGTPQITVKNEKKIKIVEEDGE